MNVDYNTETQELTVELNTPKIELDTPSGGRGLKGDKGNPGAKGDPGDPGIPGRDGEAATIEVGSTTTGDAGTDASVTNSGTTSAAVLDFTIPKGDKGDTGDTGETGNGISSIEKTSTSGLVDTYTIYFTDGTTTTYTVTNGSGGGSTTDVQINGTSITSGGTANILTEGVYSASTNKIATMSDLSSKQDTLVSGTNIKTINNTSLLGSGDITIGTVSEWGDITGTLSDQTDLQSALDGKAEKSLYGDTTINVGRASSTTVGQYSTAEGYQTEATGNRTHAEGYQTKASSESSHAEGYRTVASGDYGSHAEGLGTTASGYDSHAEGMNTIASGADSHAEGQYTEAKGAAQHVSGKYNVVDNNNTYAEIIGNGTANNARSNARTLDWSGNEVLAGKLTLGAAPTNNMDATTKQYVDNAISGIPTADVYYVPSSDSSSSNPFIFENHNPGVYIFEETSNVYIKVLSTSSTSRLSNSPWAGTGFFLLATPTSEMTDGHIIAQYMSFGIKYPYQNTITFDSNVSYNYDYSSSSQYGLEWVNLLSAQTISGLKTFSTLPQSSVVPSDNKDLANKKYVDDAVSGISATDVQINGTSITSGGTANILTETAYDSSTNKIATMSDLPTIPTLATVATTGDYDDLLDKPTIPDELADLQDDSTHRVVTDTEKSTWSGKQDALVSGTSIKTINSSSILGSGDVALSTATNLENGTGTGSLKTTGAYSATGNYSFAEGRNAVASGSWSHAEGSGSYASGDGSHAEGMGSTASGFCSHAEGGTTTADSDYQHVEGTFNIVDSNNTYIHIAGNGDDNQNRSNAYTLDWSGNGVYAGSLTVNGNQPVATTSVTGDLTNLTTTDKTDLVSAINENESEINTLKNGGEWTAITSSWGTLYYRYITDKVVHVIGDISPGNTTRTIQMPFFTTTYNAWLLAGSGTNYTKAYMNNTNGLSVSNGTSNSATYSVNIYIDTK